MSNPQLPGVLGNLGPVLDHYGYLAVAGFIALEDFGIPLPGETVLIAAAVYAGAGKLNIVLLGIVAVAAAVLGDNVGFAIGHFGGRRLVLRFGKYVLLTEHRLDKAEDFVDRHGGKIVTIARFIEGLRQANGIVAGIAGMPWLRFLAFNLLGAVLWVGVWSTLGYVAGGHIGTIYAQFQHYLIYIGIAVAVLVLGLIVRAVLHRRRASSVSEQEGSDA
ncbi:MAG: DedA family protein [Jatrophihabitantaceae bacterium]